MFFLNLSFLEFLAIAGTLSGLIAALYFFDRSKRKKTVSTLRFWTGGPGAEQQRRRKSVNQPWSLLLQILSILLLLLAIARLQWGLRIAENRNVVLLLDTSSAAMGRLAGGTILDREKVLAKQYLSRVGGRERVMLVRVNALAAPASSFTTDRRELREEIDASKAGYSALSIQRALTYARQASSRASGVLDEIVYIGPERIAEPFAGGAPGLRVLPVPAVSDSCGIRGITVTRSEGEDSWRAVVMIRNDGAKSRALRMTASFGVTAFSPRRVVIGPHEEIAVTYQFVANTAGKWTVRLQPRDDLPADDETSIMLPVSRRARVVVYSSREEAWRPLLSADKSLDVVYERPQQYRPHPETADVVILDRFAPQVRPQLASLWVDVPANGSPLPVQAEVANQVVSRWNSDADLGAGLHARDVSLPQSKVYQVFDKDFVAASTARGPVAVVRPVSENGEKLAVVGFDFLAEPLRYRVTSPILFANMMRWLAPQAFRAVQLSAEPVGLGAVPLDLSEQPDQVHVTDENGRPVPFLVESGHVQFFTEAPAIVHVVTRQHEEIVSMVLPEIARYEWKVPSSVPHTVPRGSNSDVSAMDLWQVLAVLGGLGLLVEWLLFGRQRAFRFKARAGGRAQPGSSSREREREREPVGK